MISRSEMSEIKWIREDGDKEPRWLCMIADLGGGWRARVGIPQKQSRGSSYLDPTHEVRDLTLENKAKGLLLVSPITDLVGGSEKRALAEADRIIWEIFGIDRGDDD